MGKLHVPQTHKVIFLRRSCFEKLALKRQQNIPKRSPWPQKGGYYVDTKKALGTIGNWFMIIKNLKKRTRKRRFRSLGKKNINAKAKDNKTSKIIRVLTIVFQVIDTGSIIKFIKSEVVRSIMRIHIIGCSGTGKTYFASALSKKYNIPHFDLDNLQWDNRSNEYGIKMPIEKRNLLLQQLLKKEDWIIEGVYYSWVQESFEKADIIYVLDIPKHVYIRRIVIRFLKRKLGKEKGKKETLKSLRDLLKWTDTFQKINLKEIKQIMNKYEIKVVWINKCREVDRIITG